MWVYLVVVWRFEFVLGFVCICYYFTYICFAVCFTWLLWDLRFVVLICYFWFYFDFYYLLLDSIALLRVGLLYVLVFGAWLLFPFWWLVDLCLLWLVGLYIALSCLSFLIGVVWSALFCVLLFVCFVWWVLVILLCFWFSVLVVPFWFVVMRLVVFRGWCISFIVCFCFILGCFGVVISFGLLFVVWCWFCVLMLWCCLWFYLVLYLESLILY